MKLLLRVLLAVMPMALFGAAGDIKFSQVGTAGQSFSDHIVSASAATQITSLPTFRTAIALGTTDNPTWASATLGTGNLTISTAGKGILGASSELITFSGGVITLAGGTSGSVIISATSGISGSNITLSSLTSGRVPFATTGGLLTDASTLTFSAGTLTATNYVGTFAGNTFTTGTGTLTLGAGKTTTFDHTSTFTTTDAQTYTFPTTSATLARTDAANSFTGNQTILSTSTLQFGATAAATIGASTDATNGNLNIQLPTSGGLTVKQGATLYFDIDSGGTVDVKGSVRPMTDSAGSIGTASLGFGSINGSQAGIATTSTDCLNVLNRTAATSGVPVQYSPRVRYLSQVWNTTATAANNFAEVITEVRPTSGTTPTFLMAWAGRLSTAQSGSYVDAMTLTNGGVLTVVSLAGTGSRAVLADANGLLSAPVSDELMKEPLRPLPESYGIATVMRLQPAIFKFRDKTRFGPQDYIGFGARETSKVLPEVTGQMKDGTYYLTDEKLTAVLVKAVQQQQGQIAVIASAGTADWWARGIAALAFVLALRANLRKPKS